MKKYLLFLSFATVFFNLPGKIIAQVNQVVSNGANTLPENFTGAGCVYNWVNSDPSIGLPASGTGNIASFKAINAGATPITAIITATPINPGLLTFLAL